MVSHVERLQNKHKCREIRQKIESTYLTSMKGRAKYICPLKRIYCYVCKKLGFSHHEIAYGLALKNHTTILYHLNHITEDEISRAETFLNQTHFSFTPYHPVQHKNIYEITGFRYDGGRTECSTGWKRFYPLKSIYRGS